MQLIAKFEMGGAGIVIHAKGNTQRATNGGIELIHFTVSELLIGHRRQQHPTSACLLGIFGIGQHITGTQRADTDNDRHASSVFHTELGNSGTLFGL